MTEDQILNEAQLELRDDLLVGARREETLTIKNSRSRRYLTVHQRHWRVLSYFKKPQSFKGLFPELIYERAAIPTREYAELILKALRAGVLAAPGQLPAERIKAAVWPVSIKPGFAVLLSYAMILGGLGLTVSHLWKQGDAAVPETWATFFFGYLAVLGARACAALLEATVLRGADCEVYHPKFNWRTIFPCFEFDLEDRRMIADRQGEQALALASISPMILACGLAAMQSPSFGYATLVWTLLYLAPTPASPVFLVLKAYLARVQLSLHRRFVYSANRNLCYKVNSSRHSRTTQLNLAYAAYIVLWHVLIGWLMYLPGRVHNVHFLQKMYEADNVLYTSLGLGAALAVLVVIFLASMVRVFLAVRSESAGEKPLMQSLSESVAGFRPYELPRREGTGPNKVKKFDPESAVFVLRQNPLCAPLKDEAFLKLVEAVSLMEYGKRKLVTQEGQPFENVWFVLAGEVEVSKELSSGRRVALHRLQTGDLFGYEGFLGQKEIDYRIRTLRKTVLLSLPYPVFRECIIHSIGLERMRTIVEKELFLYRIPLCHNWSLEDIAFMTQHATLEACAPGSVLIKERAPNDYFFILYSGVFDVFVNEKRVARFTQGDYFGEISLLQNSLTTATVVAQEHCKVIRIAKRDFLAFLSRDYRLVMQFEDIASKRLGKPIFPLHGNRFTNAELSRAG